MFFDSRVFYRQFRFKKNHKGVFNVSFSPRDGNSRIATTDHLRSIFYRVICVKMKTKTVLLLFVCYFFARSAANDEFLDDDYEEDPRNFDLDRVDSFREYVFGRDGESRRNIINDELEDWPGRWMPDRPNDPTPPPKIFPKISETSVQSLHGIPMGYSSQNCDDAKSNLTMDWDGNPIVHTCYDKRIVPNRSTKAIMYCVLMPKYYVAMHKCMYEKIEYDEVVPVYGTHRPLWPVYGEYKFLPKQRWLHSLEHGAIVALYHPCANPMQVRRLKSLLAGCLRRHVISPYNLLDESHPLVLISWGCRLSMSYVNPELVIEFIREHARRGPEEISKDGDFVEGLLHRAEIVSDIDDTILCPNAHTF